jgi:23S rRNA (adenine2503-C2)-methyltransferase
MNNRASIFSQDIDSLSRQLEEWNVAKFRSTQICSWLFEKRVYNPENMLNIPKPLREKLATHFDWSLPRIIDCLDAQDGASKLLLELDSGHKIETVILRYEKRTSLCVSSQVGCKLACTFCQTGKLGFFKNLKAHEIIQQVVTANEILKKEQRSITHIVFMGMGEPLDNCEEVTKACKILTDKQCYGISKRRITISTSGIVPGIEKLAQLNIAQLAISLHAPENELRKKLMPINQRYPLEKLKKALLEYQKKTGQLITIEYLLIKDENISKSIAKSLVKYLHGLRAKINLIPFNPHPGLNFSKPTNEQMLEFQKYLSTRGYPAPIRYSKGQDVSAACGQLAAKNKDNLNNIPIRKDVLKKITPVKEQIA